MYKHGKVVRGKLYVKTAKGNWINLKLLTYDSE